MKYALPTLRFLGILTVLPSVIQNELEYFIVHQEADLNAEHNRAESSLLCLPTEIRNKFYSYTLSATR